MEDPDEPKEKFQNVLELIDDVEIRVEELRKKALDLVSMRREIDETLRTLSFLPTETIDLTDVDREEATAHIIRLQRRLATTTVEVTTIRDADQEEALGDVNAVIENLIADIESDSPGTAKTLQSYLCCCSRETATEGGGGGGGGGNGGPHDAKFEKMLLACASDDQRSIEARLKALQSYLSALLPASEEAAAISEDGGGDSGNGGSG